MLVPYSAESWPFSWNLLIWLIWQWYVTIASILWETLTLWWTYKKLLKMAIEIVDVPIKNGDFPWQTVSSPEGKCPILKLSQHGQNGSCLWRWVHTTWPRHDCHDTHFWDVAVGSRNRKERHRLMVPKQPTEDLGILLVSFPVSKKHRVSPF